jgi:hypothetical protein
VLAIFETCGVVSSPVSGRRAVDSPARGARRALRGNV